MRAYKAPRMNPKIKKRRGMGGGKGLSASNLIVATSHPSAAIQAGTPAIAAIAAALALVIGTAYALVVPPLQVPDEFAHFMRAFEISEGHLVSPAQSPIPEYVIEFTGSFPARLRSATGERRSIHM